MRKALTFLLSLAMPLTAIAQQPQTQTAPIYAVNAKYSNGVSPGYWPQVNSGLVLNVGKGTVNCASTMTAYAGGTLTMANNTTNYVYLDTTASCAPASNTSGFTSTMIPIATVVTLSSVITTITDDRTPFTTVAASTGTVTGTGTNPKLAIWATGTSLGNIGTPTLCSSGQAPTGIDANGNATGCAAFGSGSTTTIANGTSALGTSAIASGACASVVTTSATGTATTDNIMADFNADPTSTTGYVAGAMLTIIKYPTANNVNFRVCNNSASSITPGAVTLNWRVVR